MIERVDQKKTLPFRAEGRLSRLLGMQASELEIVVGLHGLPKLRCTLPRPARDKTSIVLRALSRSGIRLAYASAEVNPGDLAFETTRFDVVAMEGYAHLNESDRLAVEERVWSRCALVVGSTS